MKADKLLYDAVMANDVAAVRKCLASGTHLLTSYEHIKVTKEVYNEKTNELDYVEVNCINSWIIVNKKVILKL